MYKIDFRPVGTDRRVTLKRSPVDTHAEALVVGCVAVRSYLQTNGASVLRITDSMYDVHAEGCFIGTLFLTKQ